MTLAPAATAIPTLDLDPFTPEVLSNPLPAEERLREAGPVVYLEALGVYAVARHAEVAAVLSDWQHFESGQGVGLSNFRKVAKWRATSAVLEADPPHHDAPRRVLAHILGADTQQAVRQSWSERADLLVARLLDGRPWTEIDGVADIAAAFPLMVIPDAIGIEERGRENLVPFSDFLLNAFGPRNELVTREKASGAPLSAWVDSQCLRSAATPGSWSAAIWEASDRGEILPEQAPLVLRSLFAAGVNTTVHALSALLLALSTHPAQWELVATQPTLRAAALDEAVRWHSPIQTVFRTTRGAPSVSGIPLPDNEKVLLCVGAANRDPRRWERPGDFDIMRGPAGHVGFGRGIHGCVGQHLARLEAECLLDALTRQVARLEPAGPPRRKLNNTLNAMASLPLRLHRA